jgi:HSP20 family protein
MNLINFHPYTRTSRYTPSLLDDFFGRNISDVVGTDIVHGKPSVNITETEASYRVEVAAPGLSTEDFKVSIDKKRLTSSAEETTETKSEESKMIRREFNYNSFSRTFILADSIDQGKIAATYQNGVLALTLPKRAEIVEAEKTRVIEIA